MNNLRYIILQLLLVCLPMMADNKVEIKMLPGEHWWGLATGLGKNMPFVELDHFDLMTQNQTNQSAPLLISDMGRYIWSDQPFRVVIKDGAILLNSDYERIQVEQAGKTLREAFLNVCSKHFHPSGKLPDALFFSRPQFNTWIELSTHQNQKGILDYARNIVKNGLPHGVIMIDDTWAKYYGNFEFKPELFPNPKAMVDELHAMGYKVMLWVSPFVSPDSPECYDLFRKGFLIKDKTDKWNFYPALGKWWNGQSAMFDFSNPGAVDYFLSQLHGLQKKYGIDGFKFDAADNHYYTSPNLSFYKPSTAVDHNRYWSIKIGRNFAFNELRSSWNTAGEPLVQRLCDKAATWDALPQLISEMTAAGILGYAYTCPDMIGGGQWGSFYGDNAEKLDHEMVVRSAQIHAMMPMMQFSVAPWRVLTPNEFDVVRQAAELHVKMSDYILKCACHAAATGEPIVRLMEYQFPHQGFADCRDQYMLGDRYLVTPMVNKGFSRKIVLPKGTWKDERGKKFKGGRTYVIDVPLNRIPYFEKVR